MRKISIAQVRRDLAEVVGDVKRGERVKVSRYGRTLAVLVPKPDLEKLQDCERTEETRKQRRGPRRRR
jgi:prevent-host-death family protein